METLPISLLKELSDFKINPNVTLKKEVKRFYEILRKYGIKQGTKTETGSLICNNLEFTLCLNYLEQSLHFFVRLDVALNIIKALPKDLEHY